MRIDQLNKKLKKHGLVAIQCNEHHFQFRGSNGLIVNYYPNSKRQSIYINGAVSGKRMVSLDEAIKIATGSSNKPVSNTIDRRKKSYRSTKLKLFKKSNICYWCKEIVTMEQATVEHIIPLSKGGSNRDDNLTLAHDECNAAHSNKLPKSEI